MSQRCLLRHKRPLTSLSSSTSGGETKVLEPRITLSETERDNHIDNHDEQDKAILRPFPYYIDTHSAVVQLQRAGHTSSQSEAVIKIMMESLDGAVGPIKSTVLSHQDLELMELRIQKEQEAVANRLYLLERTTLESLQNENIALKDKIEKLMSGFKDEVSKVQSNLQLDLNLEKGRIKEEAAHLIQEVRDTNNRIDKEAALIRTQIEAQKLESVKYLAGVTLSVVTVVLSVAMGVWRLMK